MSIVDSIRRGRPRQLDDKACFDAWIERGTLEKAHRWLNENEFECSKPGVRHAAWRWVILHPDEALEIWQDYDHFPEGKDSEEWKHWIAGKIRTFRRSSREQFDQSLELNGIKEWYYEQEEYQSCPIKFQT